MMNNHNLQGVVIPPHTKKTPNTPKTILKQFK